ncbi:MAG: hypothetical protein JF887_10170, partial [Candidatus Dormibacteraeota bacterium]|nr:hypothetical protein [Candidatus Dormibacteraeota bacterium]
MAAGLAAGRAALAGAGFADAALALGAAFEAGRDGVLVVVGLVRALAASVRLPAPLVAVLAASCGEERRAAVGDLTDGFALGCELGFADRWVTVLAVVLTGRAVGLVGRLGAFEEVALATVFRAPLVAGLGAAGLATGLGVAGLATGLGVAGLATGLGV